MSRNADGLTACPECPECLEPDGAHRMTCLTGFAAILATIERAEIKIS